MKITDQKGLIWAGTSSFFQDRDDQSYESYKREESEHRQFFLNQDDVIMLDYESEKYLSLQEPSVTLSFLRGKYYRKIKRYFDEFGNQPLRFYGHTNFADFEDHFLGSVDPLSILMAE